MSLQLEDKTVICPYNPAHVIREKRLQFHLVKCRKNYPMLNYAICSLDSTHHVPRKELKFHEETCPRRFVVDRFLFEYKSDNSNVAPPLPKSVVESILPETEESWDDVNVPTYVPDCSKRNVLRILRNAPPAEKKQFQELERKRLIEL